MKRHSKTLLFSAIIILIVAAFFRFWKINAVPPGLYSDEAMNGNNALYAVESGDFRMFYPENNGREGLFINIIAASFKIFGPSATAMRLVAAIFGLATVAGIFFLARELFKEKFAQKDLIGGLKINDVIGLAAGMFMAVNLWHINFSRIGFRAIMAPFFLVWSMWFLWLIFRPNLSSKLKILSALASGLLFGFGFHSYIAYRASPLILIAPALKIKKKGGLKILGWFLIMAAAIISPLAVYFWQNPSDFFGRTGQISIFASETPVKDFIVNLAKTFGSFWFNGDQNARHNIPGRPQLWLPVGILFAIGLISNIFALARKSDEKPKSKTEVIFLLSWLFIFSLPAAFSSEGVPHALRSILILPAALIFAACVFGETASLLASWIKKTAEAQPERTIEMRRLRFEVIFLAIIFFAAYAIFSFYGYFQVWASLPETYYAFNTPYAGIAEWLNGLPKELPKYVIVNSNGVLARAPDQKNAQAIPMPAQTAMFLTQSWTAKGQKVKNINYILPDKIADIACRSSCAITMLEQDLPLAVMLKQTINGLKLSAKNGFAVYYKNYPQ